MSAGTHWLCKLSKDSVSLVCLADVDPSDDAQPVIDPVDPPVAHRGAGFPLDHRLVYTVALWNVPGDTQWLELLARATMCYRSPGCTVSVAPVQGLDASPVPVVSMR